MRLGHSSNMSLVESYFWEHRYTGEQEDSTKKTILIIFLHTRLGLEVSTRTGGQAETGCQVTSTSIGSESEKENFSF